MLRNGALVFVGTLLAGCSILQAPLPAPVEEPVEVVVVEEPSIPIVKAEPKPEPKVELPPAPPLSVSIVLTNNQPAYADVARELAQHFDNHAIYDLAEDSRPPSTILRVINDDAPSTVVAIGLRAATSSIAISDRPVVFSQVFNYEHHGLLQDNSRGVAAWPPVEAQVAAWKEVDPSVRRIGLIIGAGHDELLREAQLAAERHDIDLVIEVSRSDQETLYLFRRMVRDIDGFWLLPDSRILSSRALRQMLADAKQRQVPVSVPTESMLSLGASMSMTTEAEDIAAAIAGVVRKIHAGDLDRVPAITPLSAISIKLAENDRVASR